MSPYSVEALDERRWAEESSTPPLGSCFECGKPRDVGRCPHCERSVCDAHLLGGDHLDCCAGALKDAKDEAELEAWEAAHEEGE